MIRAEREKLPGDIPAATELGALGRRLGASLAVLLRNRLAALGLCLVLLILLSALFAPYLTTHDPFQMNLPDRLKGSSAEHLLGTDIYGRDIYTRVILGARIAMRVAFGAVLLAVLIGVPVGAVA